MLCTVGLKYRTFVHNNGKCTLFTAAKRECDVPSDLLKIFLTFDSNPRKDYTQDLYPEMA